ncbi:TetR/AcrR family transcriptional regulator [Duganella sp. LX20W]|uniref:TetR/AcrR family transcriptional regulator n=1 Tax=Rugamonas brunnea TaxID=2758569 RepID=A0A7W2EVJ8_9BURK|nr:TetR/AcrR family transcriptional regulator [Rugamonas brunnea]MBA5639394.1 TetR/AcrR family transcriptional regulator [Rugamonas brunnea]
MARPKSEEKRKHLLEAAAAAVAERGVGASTALIAKMAGVAEGTLFRYFPSKEALLNETYLFLCEQMTQALSQAFEASQPLPQRARAIWDRYIDWGLANRSWHRATAQLSVTEILTEETRAADVAMFPDVGLAEALASSEILAGNSPRFGDALLVAIADVTIQFAAMEPNRAEAYKISGFKAFQRMFLD